MNVLQVGTDFVDMTNVRNQELLAARHAPVHEASNRSTVRQRKWVRPPTEGYADEPILVPASEDEDWEKDKDSDHEMESDQEQEEAPERAVLPNESLPAGSYRAKGPWLPRGYSSNVSLLGNCLLYTSPSPRDLSTSRMPSSA